MPKTHGTKINRHHISRQRKHLGDSVSRRPRSVGALMHSGKLLVVSGILNAVLVIFVLRRGNVYQPQPVSATALQDAPPSVVQSDSVRYEDLPSEPPGRAAWLVIGIPCAPRKSQGKDVDYLGTTLESLLVELPSDPSDPMYGRVRVIVLNTAPGINHAMTSLRVRLRASKSDDLFAKKAAVYVETIDSPGRGRDPGEVLPDPDDLNNPTNRPGRQVRQQTLDLLVLLELARSRGRHYLFMEDDFTVCPHMIRVIHYALAKLREQQPDWLALRFSYGMNGIMMKSKDIPNLSRYLRAGMTRLPPDLLWQEWAYGKNRPKDLLNRRLAVYKWNMLAHRGNVSSFAVRIKRAPWPGCYVRMDKPWSLGIQERFRNMECGFVSDISPCQLAKQRWHLLNSKSNHHLQQQTWMDHQLIWRQTEDRMPTGSTGQAFDQRLIEKWKRSAEELSSYESRRGRTVEKQPLEGVHTRNNPGASQQYLEDAQQVDEENRIRLADNLSNRGGDSGSLPG